MKDAYPKVCRQSKNEPVDNRYEIYAEKANLEELVDEYFD